MTQLILIRAGQTEWQAQGRLTGDADLQLNEAGRQKATERAAAAALLKPVLLYCGEDGPASETAGIVGQALKLKVRELKAFREMDLGHWEGLTTDQFRDRFPRVYKQWHTDPLAVEPPEGESITTVVARIKKRLARTFKKADGKPVALVLGGFAHSALRCEFGGDGFDDFWEYVDGDDGGIVTIDNAGSERAVSGTPAAGR